MLFADFRFTPDMGERVEERLRLILLRSRYALMSRAGEMIEKTFHKMEEIRFDSSGPGWAPLAQATLDYKASHGYPSDILIRTGALQESLLGQGSFVIREITPEALFVGTGVLDERGRPYAHYHQYGQGSNKLRPLVHINQAAASVFAEILMRYITEGNVSDPFASSLGSWVGPVSGR